MGCTNSFLYNSQPYKDLLYSEKTDKRLGRVYLMRSAAANTAYIAKELSEAKGEQVESRIIKFRMAFGPSARLFLMPLGTAEQLNVLKSEQCIQKKSGRCLYLKIEFFQRDFGDELNVKALKQKRFYSFEIWSLLYTLIFALAILEESGLALVVISFDDILITNNSYKYFYPPMFGEFLPQEDREEIVFERAVANVLFLALAMAIEPRGGELPAFNISDHDQKALMAEYERLKLKLDEELRRFLYNVLITNSPGYTNFRALKKHLVLMYDKMEYEVIDEKLIEDLTR